MATPQVSALSPDASGDEGPGADGPGTDALGTETSSAILAVADQLTVMFTRVKSNMRERAAGIHPGLQPFGYVMLVTLAHTGPKHAGALAELLSSDKSIISRQAGQLEEFGLLRREQDPTDRRATYFTLTDEGSKRVEAVRREGQKALHETLAEWTVDDLEQLASLLSRINEI